MTLHELRELSKKVRDCYESEGPSFSDFQKKTGLHCLPGCGACCNHPEVSSSMSEMLPMALTLFDRGDAILFYDRLKNLESKSTCLLYKASAQDINKGSCNEYQFRPVVCRSFGACGVKKKDGEKVLSLCHHIKGNTEVKVEELPLNEAPLIENFASAVRSLDADTKIYPINLALKMALEKVLMAANYENEYSKL